MVEEIPMWYKLSLTLGNTGFDLNGHPITPGHWKPIVTLPTWWQIFKNIFKSIVKILFGRAKIDPGNWKCCHHLCGWQLKKPLSSDTGNMPYERSWPLVSWSITLNYIHYIKYTIQFSFFILIVYILHKVYEIKLLKNCFTKFIDHL